ncbi:GNAT family N-acetyltransferase [Asanoa siamensis]|uniref:N-acetyltransferase domain-containing protein n=1 Tax=Asanoa siamensis TaxID=926357 RepID=A0ABQ4D2P0_9ACTN|nr:GNAT family N-acetyltransferase [Asanoa siamensis]GIF77392.1 hypothetical protein Asi02nite_69100 [Asanoa siamensis]
MTEDPLLARARRLWCLLAGAPVGFTARGVDVVVSPKSALCPPGWVGIVSLGGVAIATVPDAWSLRALAVLPASSWQDPAAIRDGLPVRESLGPATLAYLDPAAFTPVGGGAEPVPVGNPAVKDLLARVPAAEADESALTDITSPAFVLRSGTEVVAAAGYRRWPGGVAHLCVLTSPTHRGQGLARTTATAAVTSALHAGMLAQWRARHAASRRVAVAVGFRELGWHLSLRLEA